MGGGTGPLYVTLFAHHYHGQGGYYATAAEVRAVAEVVAEAGLATRCALFFDGIGADRLASEDPALAAWIRKSGFAVGYHGEDVHGPGPVVADLGALGGAQNRGIAAGVEDFDEAAAAIRLRVTHGLSGVQIRGGQLARGVGGETDPSREGGVARVRSWTGRPVEILTGNALFAPAAVAAFADLAPGAVLQEAGPLAMHFAMATGDRELLARVGAFVGAKTGLFRYMGQLAMIGTPRTALPAWDLGGGKGGLPPGGRLHKALGAISGPVVASYKIDGEAADLRSALAAIQAELARRPGSRFAGPGELAGLVAPLGEGCDPAAVAAAALAQWDGGPPDALDLGGDRAISLCDGVEVLARALAGEALTTTGVWGPTDGPGALVRPTGAVTRSDAVAAAPRLLAALDAHPHRALPAALAVGTIKVGFHQLLPLFAHAVASPGAARITLAEGDFAPPFARWLVTRMARADPANDSWTLAQYWTVKPARWRA